MTVLIVRREIDGLITDLEGTLTGKEQDDAIFVPARIEIARRLLTFSGQELSEESVREKECEYRELAMVIGWKPAYISLGGYPDDYHLITKSIDRSAGITFNPELYSMLESFRPHVSMGILTRATMSITEGICAKLLGDQWKCFFSAVVCGDTPGCPASKPDSRAFQFAANQMSVAEERTAMVGNNLVDDITPALKRGMLAIFVGDQKEGPWDIRISKVEELASIIFVSSVLRNVS